MNDNYPSVFRRYFAAVVDMIVAFSIAVFIGKYLSPTGEITHTNVWAIILAFFLYEPVLTITYATVGQLIFRFRVRRLDKKNKISIFQALPRFIIKYLLGWLSLMTVPARADRRAMHDLATNTIAVNAGNTK
jgi:hypothetical protein